MPVSSSLALARMHNGIDEGLGSLSIHKSHVRGLRILCLGHYVHSVHVMSASCRCVVRDCGGTKTTAVNLGKREDHVNGGEGDESLVVAPLTLVASNPHEVDDESCRGRYHFPPSVPSRWESSDGRFSLEGSESVTPNLDFVVEPILTLKEERPSVCLFKLRGDFFLAGDAQEHGGTHPSRGGGVVVEGSHPLVARVRAISIDRLSSLASDVAFLAPPWVAWRGFRA